MLLSLTESYVHCLGATVRFQNLALGKVEKAHNPHKYCQKKDTISHFNKNDTCPTKSEKININLLEKYRQMSQADSGFIRKFVLNELDTELLDKFYKIFEDKATFVPQEDELENNREQKVIDANRRIHKLLDESDKILPIKDIMDDPIIFAAFSVAVSSYNVLIQALNNIGVLCHEVGCFGLTELGHGSNVKGIETTATYDNQTREYVINTPHTSSMKFWIGNGSKTATISVIFAQLYINDRCYGPHAFITPLRDPQSFEPLSTVTIGDCGRKLSIDTIDNGFFIFKNHRIPKSNLLNRFSDVNEKGEFISNIKNDDKRFALQLGALSGGRISLIGGSQVGLQQALKIALRYAVLRQQFGPPKSEKEVSLIEYPSHQFRLFSYAAQSIAIMITSQKYLRMQSENQKELFNDKNPKISEIHAASSILKALSTWTCYQGIQECRRACGGLGFSFHAKFGILLNNNDVNQTWEGDNNVLLQQAGKYVLDQRIKVLKGQEIQDDTLQFLSDKYVLQTMRLSKSEIANPQSILRLFQVRISIALNKVIRKLNELTQKTDQYQAWNISQVFEVRELAINYGDYLIVKEFKEKLDKLQFNQDQNSTTQQDTKECLTYLFYLDAYTRLLNGKQYLIISDDINMDGYQFLQDQIHNCLIKLKPHMIRVTDMFPPNDNLFNNILAPQDGDLYKSVHEKIVSDPQVYDKIGIWQEIKQYRESKQN
ncbi:acyl-coenzyme a oxidase [Stylonychia lemnae]|uniref:acyl-CoA oxidase n=1 Tax=Stylonychia lemnae TaxID=5949 RepID=A0A078ASA5_STYLE|nr:acyl-coenzyme a oxidase [Stylonychia lemnae]|eukprot:CDW85064.1 acyl-coenzyme a oxidase [Stylonychia lemnae]